MTEEEMNQKIKEAEDKAARAEEQIRNLETQRSNQNSYITKLEGKVKGLESSMETAKAAVNQAPVLSPEITEYFQKKRREDYIEQATTEIVSQIGQEKFDCLKDELNDFLKLYMSEKNVSVRYIIDSFNLLLGRAVANTNHPIQKILLNNKPSEEPKQVPTNDADRALFSQTIGMMQNKTMTNEDINAGGAPEVKAPTVNNTKEAMDSFKKRFYNLDSSRFE